MSEAQDSWFKDAFGVDLGQSLNKIKDEASAALGQATSTVSQVVTGVQGAVGGVIDGVTGAAVGVVKKVAGAVSPSGSSSAGSSGGGTGSFPLGGSVGRGGKNAPNDVRAVQAALGIAADGQCGAQTIAAIEAFQRNLGQTKADGRVDAGGGTERALAGGAKSTPTPAPEEDGGFTKRLEDAAAGLVPVINIPGLGDVNIEASINQAANQVVARNAPKLPVLARAEALLGEARSILDTNGSPNGSIGLPPATISFTGKCCSLDDLQKFRTALEPPRNGLQSAVNAFNDAERGVVEASEQGKRICIGGLVTCIVGSGVAGQAGVAACIAGAVACILGTTPVQNAIRVQARAEADLEVANGALERALANHRNCFGQRCGPELPADAPVIELDDPPVIELDDPPVIELDDPPVDEFNP